MKSLLVVLVSFPLALPGYHWSQEQAEAIVPALANQVSSEPGSGDSEDNQPDRSKSTKPVPVPSFADRADTSPSPDRTSLRESVARHRPLLRMRSLWPTHHAKHSIALGQRSLWLLPRVPSGNMATLATADLAHAPPSL